jgi:hypothetical protein
MKETKILQQFYNSSQDLYLSLYYLILYISIKYNFSSTQIQLKLHAMSYNISIETHHPKTINSIFFLIFLVWPKGSQEYRS